MPSALSTMLFFTPLLLAPLANAIQLTAPAEDNSIAAGSSAEVIWNKTPRDASRMSLYLANYVNWPPSIVPLAHDVSTSATEWTVQIPCNTPASYGYQIVAVEDGNVYEVYAVGDRFEVSAHQGEAACWDWNPAGTLQTDCGTTAPCDCSETQTSTDTGAKPTLAERAVVVGDGDDVEALSNPEWGHPGYGKPGYGKPGHEHDDSDDEDDDHDHDSDSDSDSDDEHHHDSDYDSDDSDDEDDKHKKHKKKHGKKGKKDKKKKGDKKDKKHKKKGDKKHKKKDDDKKDKKDKKKDKKGKDKKKDKKHKKHGKEDKEDKKHHKKEAEAHEEVAKQSWLAGW